MNPQESKEIGAKMDDLRAYLNRENISHQSIKFSEKDGKKFFYKVTLKKNQVKTFMVTNPEEPYTIEEV